MLDTYKLYLDSAATYHSIKYTYPDEVEVIYLCHHGAGYGAKSGIYQGFANMATQLDSIIDDTPLPVGILEK